MIIMASHPTVISPRSCVQRPTPGALSSVQRPAQGPANPPRSTVQRPLWPTDIPDVGADGWAMVADSGEHPDRRIPYRLAGEL